MDERVAVVTGAANGIGRATAELLSERGYRVEAWDVDRERLAELPDVIVGREIDVARLPEVEAAIAELGERHGRLDLLVNNAIWRELKSIQDLTLESWNRTLQIGLTIPAFLSRCAAPLMRDSGGGVIVNVSSIMSRRAGGVSPAYVAAKGGLDSLTYELAVCYAKWRIRVVGIRPGAIETSLSRDYGRDGDSAVDAMRRWSCDQIPLGRWGRPAEVAAAIAMMSSDDASYITGTTLAVDGGWSTAHFPASMRESLHDA